MVLSLPIIKPYLPWLSLDIVSSQPNCLKQQIMFQIGTDQDIAPAALLDISTQLPISARYYLHEPLSVFMQCPKGF